MNHQRVEIIRREEVQEIIDEVTGLIRQNLRFFRSVQDQLEFFGAFDCSEVNVPGSTNVVSELLKCFAEFTGYFEVLGEEHDYFNDPEEHQYYLKIASSTALFGWFFLNRRQISYINRDEVDLSVTPYFIRRVIKTFTINSNFKSFIEFHPFVCEE